MALRDLLHKDVAELFGRKGESLPTEARCTEARLEIRNNGPRLEFWCTLPRMRFFSIPASLGGALSVSRSLSEDKVPTTRLLVPLLVDGSENVVQVIFCGDEAPPSLTLAQSSMLPQADANNLQFNFGEDKQQMMFTFMVPSELEVRDFQQVNRKAKVSGPPSVAQLAAVLRATLQQRRDTVSTLEDLAVPLSVETVKMVALMREKLSPRHSFQTPPLQWLQEDITSHHRSFNPSTLAALTLLLDMEAGLWNPSDVEQLAHGSLNLTTSWEALTQVAHFLKMQLNPTEWRKKFTDAGLTFPERPDASLLQTMASSFKLIEERMMRRDTRAVFINLVRESPSPRAEELVRIWKRSLQVSTKGKLEGFEGFCQFVSALGCRMDPNTLLALCLYAETEASRIAADQFEQWLEARASLTLSAYTMQAVASALDMELLALSTPSTGKISMSLYQSLFRLCPQGMLQGLTSINQDATNYRFIDSSMDLESTIPVGWRASGDVLLKTGFLERVTQEEMLLFLNLGNTFLASFQSDLDRRHVWKKMAPGQVRDASFTFVEGFRVYHFQNRILADVVPQDSMAGGTSPGLYKDHRGSLHYLHPLEHPPEGSPLEKAPLRISFPPIESLPSILQEMDQEKMLGRVVAVGTSEFNKLDLIDQALKTLLVHKSDEGPALTSKGLQSIVRNLDSPRLLQRLRQVMDARTLDAFKREYLNAEFSNLEYRIYEPILKGLKFVEVMDFVCLALIYELCVSDLTGSKSLLKVYDRHWFRAALRNQLLVILESPNPVIRQMGCRLLATDASLEDPTERPIVEYELVKHLGSDDAGCVQEAATSLCRLVMEKALALPRVWNIRKMEAAAPSSQEGGGNLEERLRAQHLDAIRQVREWQHRLGCMVAGEYRPVPTESATALGRARGGMKDLAWLMVAAREAVKEDERRGKIRKSTILLVVSEHGLVEFLKKFMSSWQAYAEHSHSSLPEVVQEILADKALPGYMEFVKQSDDFSHLWWPLDHAMDEWVPYWLLRDISTPEPLWIMEPGLGSGVRINPIFSAVVHKASETMPDKVRICRLGSVTDARRTHPSAFKLEVFNSSSGRFTSFLEEMRIPGQFFLTVREQDLLNALDSLALHVEAAEVDVVVAAESESASTMTYRYGKRHKDDADHESSELLALARSFSEIFQLSGAYLPQLMYILKGARTYSIYNLW